MTLGKGEGHRDEYKVIVNLDGSLSLGKAGQRGKKEGRFILKVSGFHSADYGRYGPRSPAKT